MDEKIISILDRAEPKNKKEKSVQYQCSIKLSIYTILKM
jgi:hypothetical protein